MILSRQPSATPVGITQELMSCPLQLRFTPSKFHTKALAKCYTNYLSTYNTTKRDIIFSLVWVRMRVTLWEIKCWMFSKMPYFLCFLTFWLTLTVELKYIRIDLSNIQYLTKFREISKGRVFVYVMW